MGKILKLGIVLFIITAVTGLILGGVYTMTLEPIRMAQEREKTEAMIETLPGATEFENVEIGAGDETIKEIHMGKSDGGLVGYNYTVTPKGYGGLIEIVAGISKEGKLMAIKIIKHSETPGLGAKADDEAFLSQFREKTVRRLTVTKSDAANEGEIQAISGATITSNAVARGVNAALRHFWTVYSDAPGDMGDEPADAVTGATQQKSETEEDEN